VAERRLCSILFVDLVGFTPLAEKRDAEEIRELLSLYFERAQAIVGHYGGTVEKFIGDAVMAVWGAPVANEDDAERAVRAGLEIVASVAELGVEAGIDGLSARGGVVTGEAAITIGKVAEGMVLGDTVNSASRVQSAAPPGAVLVDESTWRAASGAISFVEFGALTLKGKEDPVQAWRALRVVAQRKGVGRSDRIEPPFVGRDEELRLIRDLLHATEREQRARLVSVTGIPGIGKSRLAWEFLKYVDGLVDTVYWHQGRSPAYGEGVTFWALGEMVRMRARINESEAATSSRSKLSSAVAEFVPDAEERRWVEPRLAHLLGLAEAPAGDREELFSAWRTFFERIAAVGPIVMVFEDLQWADPGLIDFIESILEWSRTTRSWSSHSRAPSSWIGGPPGVRVSAALPRFTSSPFRERACGRCSTVLCRVCRTRLPLACSSGLRACHCMPSRWCACSSTATCSCNTRGPTASPASSVPWRFRRPCRRSLPLGSTPCRPTSAPSSRMPPSSGRRSPHGPLRCCR
jgi:class 3 adenylate cyclase